MFFKNNREIFFNNCFTIEKLFRFNISCYIKRLQNAKTLIRNQRSQIAWRWRSTVFRSYNLKKMKKIFDIRIIRDRKNRTLRMNQFYYLSEMLDDLHINTNKHDRTKISWTITTRLNQLNQITNVSIQKIINTKSTNLCER